MEEQRFKIVLPILKTRIEIRKDERGVEKEVRFVEGVASSTDKDLHGDKMDASAIKSMAESLKFHEVPLNADHDTTWSAEIGPVVKLEVTEDNDLVLEAELSEMSKANDLWYALTKQNKKLGLSIGGYVKEYEMVKEEEKDDDGNVTGETHWYRLYKDIDLDHVAVTSSPANPKTWVSAISKSIDPKRDLELMKAIDTKKDKEPEEQKEVANKDWPIEKKRTDKEIKDLARRIARKVQDVEANLLLELTESVLFRMNSRQIDKIEKYLEEFNERNMSMDKKDISLEADKAKETADLIEKDGESESDKPAEESATLENEPSDDTSGKESAEPTPNKEEEIADESKGDEPKDDESGSDSEEEESNEKPEEADEANDGEESEEESKEESTEEKSQSNDLIDVIKNLNKNLEDVVENNKALAKRVEELERQPAQRKGIEIDKGLGDEDSDEELTQEELNKKLNEEIAKAEKDHATNPYLFSIKQKIREKYAQKARDISA